MNKKDESRNDRITQEEIEENIKSRKKADSGDLDLLLDVYKELALDRHKVRGYDKCLVCSSTQKLHLVDARLSTGLPKYHFLDDLYLNFFTKGATNVSEELKEQVGELSKKYIAQTLLLACKDVQVALCQYCLVECADNTHTVCSSCGFHNNYDHEEHYHAGDTNDGKKIWERITIRLKRAGLILDNYELVNGGDIIINPFCFKCDVNQVIENLAKSFVC